MLPRGAGMMGGGGEGAGGRGVGGAAARAADPGAMHIFARTPKTDYAEVEVKDGASVTVLKEAIIAKLMLDIPVHLMRLLLEVEGGAPMPLDIRKKLGVQSVFEGSSVLVEVMELGNGACEALDSHKKLAAEGVVPVVAHPLLPPFISMDSKPKVSPILEYQGLTRSKELSLFYRAALSAQPGPLCAASGTRTWRLENPEDPSKALKWPFLGASVLLERDFYSRFLSEGEWLDNLSGPTQCKFAVLGQPGIGKSAFGLWLLAHLIRNNRTVVYSRNFSQSGSLPDVKHVIFHRGGAFITVSADLGPANSLLSDPSVVHLCDSIKPSGAALCHKVLIASPDPSVWRWFVMKEYAKNAYFPLLNLAELEALRKAEFGDSLSQDTVALRVKAWGPFPRAVFSPNQRAVGEDLVLALSDKSLEELQKAMSEVRAPRGEASNDTPHALFTLQADRETLRSDGITFRSEAVAERVGRQVALLNRDTIIPTLLRFLGSSVTRSVAGSVFEMAAIDVLGRSGCGEYLVRPLTPLEHSGAAATAPAFTASAAGSSTQPPWQPIPTSSAMQRFDTLPQMARTCGAGTWSLESQYFKPTSTNFASIDLIGPGLQLFQVTATRSTHDLKVTSGRWDEEGLLALYRTLLPLLPERWGAAQPHLDVCFVVPEGLGKDWKMQKLMVYKPKAASGNKKGGGGGSKQKHSGADTAEDEEADAARELPVVSIVDTAGGGTGFSFDGKVVEVRQYLMELPKEVFDTWLRDGVQGRDAIDEASES